MAGKSQSAPEKDAQFADIAALSFEQALGELETIVRQLESGDAKLDDAIRAYERGTALKQHCAAKLQEAETKIERIVGDGQGGVRTEPADPE